MAEAQTARYYEANAATFFDQTVAVDISALRQRFVALLPSGAAILDAGCGSGRDARAFAEAGYRVAAFDASPALVALAREHTGLPVQHRTFQDLREQAAYDGIWACASLLHVPAAEEVDVLARVERALKPGGVLYVSYKRGEGEREDGGRLFRDHTCASLQHLLAALPALRLLDCWETSDVRPGRSEIWTNALLRKT